MHIEKHRKFDLLGSSFPGRIIGWRWGRLSFQISLLILAIFIIYDGFTGPQLAAANNATLLVWVHYRGFVILSLLFIGNVFCFACPFTITRSVAKKISSHGRRFPHVLRNKWVSVAGLFILFWLYEWLDLWASPWLTAWLLIAYFFLSFALEAIFHESPFCKVVCPIGAFNFTYATISPFQITKRDAPTCRTCENKECVTGSGESLGCGTELYVPVIDSNMDCTFCLDCARACPYTNVSLPTRAPAIDLITTRPPRWDLAFLFITLTFMGVMNAFGMVAPIYRLHEWLAIDLRIQSEGVRLLLILGVGNIILPMIVLLLAAWASRLLNPRASSEKLKNFASRYAPGFVPLGFGIWMAHYGFHFIIGGFAIIPVFQSFVLDHNLTLLGDSPNWDVGFMLPSTWIFPLQVAVVLMGFAASLYVIGRVSLQNTTNPQYAFRELLPWAITLVLITIISLSIFNLPMEMRGALGFGI